MHQCRHTKNVLSFSILIKENWESSRAHLLLGVILERHTGTLLLTLSQIMSRKMFWSKKSVQQDGTKEFNFLEAKSHTKRAQARPEGTDELSCSAQNPQALRGIFCCSGREQPPVSDRSDKSLSSAMTRKDWLRSDTTLGVRAELQRLHPQPPPALLSPLQVTEAQMLCPSTSCQNLPQTWHFFIRPTSNSNLLWLFHWTLPLNVHTSTVTWDIPHEIESSSSSRSPQPQKQEGSSLGTSLGWNYMVLKVPSNPAHAMIPWSSWCTINKPLCKTKPKISQSLFCFLCCFQIFAFPKLE